MKNGLIFQPNLETGDYDSYNLYCVIDVGDTIVLNYPFLGDAFPPTLILCTTPSLNWGVLGVDSWAGPVLERYNKHSVLCGEKRLVPGSIMIDTSNWNTGDKLMSIYKCGAMNKSIHRVMKKYGITDYLVPPVSKSSKYYSKYQNRNWFPFPE